MEGAWSSPGLQTDSWMGGRRGRKARQRRVIVNFVTITSVFFFFPFFVLCAFFCCFALDWTFYKWFHNIIEAQSMDGWICWSYGRRMEMERGVMGETLTFATWVLTFRHNINTWRKGNTNANRLDKIIGCCLCSVMYCRFASIARSLTQVVPQ